MVAEIATARTKGDREGAGQQIEATLNQRDAWAGAMPAAAAATLTSEIDAMGTYLEQTAIAQAQSAGPAVGRSVRAQPRQLAG
jgi:hypothetical protein